MEDKFDTIAEAFSRTAEKYDSFANDHPNQTRMRNKVYSHVQRFVPAGSRILENFISDRRVEPERCKASHN